MGEGVLYLTKNIHRRVRRGRGVLDEADILDSKLLNLKECLNSPDLI